MKSLLGRKRNRVYVEEPHQKSMASLILLIEQYAHEEIKEWLAFREEFLDSFPVLRCVYCGRNDLMREIPDMTDKAMLKQLATVDHVQPVSKGGAVYDRKNLVVACFPCNRKKGNKVS